MYLRAGESVDARFEHLNAICPYYTMFPLSFPLAALSDAKAGTSVLDPFCGRGTTLYAARLHGLRAFGVDSNRVAAIASAAKLVSPSPKGILDRFDELSERTTRAIDIPAGRFWELCFSDSVLQTVCAFRSHLKDSDDTRDIALSAIMLGALHGPRTKSEPSYFSNQMPRTYSTKPGSAVRYWEKRGLMPDDVDIRSIVERNAYRRYEATPNKTDSAVRCGDAATELRRTRRRFDITITSPPYPGMATYKSDQWLRNWFVGSPPEVDYTHDGQLGGSRGSAFAEGLTDVWKAVADRSNPGAKLIVRFGGIPSASKNDPGELLTRTLHDSEHWRVKSVVSAGVPTAQSRQANQFADSGDHADEIDLTAELIG